MLTGTFKKSVFSLIILSMLFYRVFGLSANDGGDSRPYLCISGIVFDKDQNFLVILNDEIFNEGESIEGLRIVKIEENSVYFEYQGDFFSKAVGEDCRKPAALATGSQRNQDFLSGQVARFKGQVSDSGKFQLIKDKACQFISSYPDMIRIFSVILILLAFFVLLFYFSRRRKYTNPKENKPEDKQEDRKTDTENHGDQGPLPPPPPYRG